MAEKTTSAEPTQAPTVVAEPAQEPNSALLWFQEENGAYVVYHGSNVVVRSSNWGNVLAYAHENKLPLSFSRKEHRVGNFPLEGGTPVPPENWCPADRIWSGSQPSGNDPKGILYYEDFIQAVDSSIRDGGVTQRGLIMGEPYKGLKFQYKSDGVVAPTAKGPAEPTAKGPAEPTAKGPAEPTAKGPAEPTAKGPAEPTAKGPAGPTQAR
jgi:hypothetical protein